MLCECKMQKDTTNTACKILLDRTQRLTKTGRAVVSDEWLVVGNQIRLPNVGGLTTSF